MKYKINNWLKRVKRAFQWGWFTYKQRPWLEYDNLSAIIERYLLEMSKEFKEKDITVSSIYNSQRMVLAAKLLKRGTSAYYENEYVESMWLEDMLDPTYPAFTGGFHPTYNLSDSLKAEKKDQKAIELAFKIISRDLTRWWQ